MNNTSRGIRLNSLLVLAIIGTVSIVLVSALLLFYRSYRSALYTNARTTGQQSIAQVGNTVNDYLDGINSRMDTISSSLEEDMSEREEFFDAVLQIMPEVAAISTYDADGGLINVYGPGHEAREVIETNLSFDMMRLAAEPEGYLSLPHVETLFEEYYPWVITLVRPVRASGREKWIALDISCSNIAAYINNVGIGRRGYCFLIAEDGTIVYHPQQQLIYSELKAENTGLITSLPDGSSVNGDIIYSIRTLNNDSWRVVGVSYVRELISDSLSELVRILLIAAGLVFVTALIISAVVGNVLSRPVKELESAMRRFEDDADNFVYEPVGGAREIRNLGESFRHMAVRVRD